jgi:2-octaprenyl-3-methyl-6-methoxy-1,4-benzoquinol hydroxylase/2-octaprenylphenol hydroxylase
VSAVERCDVVVAGAGIVGAAAALALARGGLDVVVTEPRAPAPFDPAAPYDLRVFAVSPASVALLARLGVWPRVVAARASAYAHMRVWERDGADEIGFDAPLIGEEQLGWIVEDRVLRDALWRALETEPRVTRLAPATVSALDVTASAVRVGLADGRTLRTRLVVAADGADSPVRALAGLATGGAPYRERAVVANVRTERPHQATAWQRFTPEGPLAFLPLAGAAAAATAVATDRNQPGHDSSIVWSLPDPRAAAVLALDDDAFRAALAQAFDARLGAVVATSPRAAFPLRLQLADRYVGPRVALVGDAAHVVHPLAGQGLNLGLQDAAALAEVVSGAAQDRKDVGELGVLRRYDAWRRGDSAIAARTFDALDRLFRSELPALPWLRRTGMGLVGRATPFRRMFALHASGWAGRVPALQKRL